jgi:hypothetical protein
METINELWTTAESRRQARVRDEYRSRGGELEDWPLAADDATWPTPESLRDLQVTLRAAADLQTLGLRHLLRFATGEYLLRQTHTLGTDLLARQQTAMVEVPVLDEPVPLWQVSSRLALERKRVLREALDNATTTIIQGLHPRQRQLWSHLYSTTEALGYVNLIALWETFTGVDLDAFLKSIEAILRDTEDTYRERMQWHLKRALGITLETAKRHDVLALFGRDATAAWFPRSEMLPCLDRWLLDWGWRSEEHPNLRVERRTAAPAGAWCAAIEIPEDIRLSLAPADGLQGYAQAFRETGKALLLTSFPAHAARALRCFPDPSLIEAQAELIGGLIRSPRWVQIYRQIRQPTEQLNLAQLERLFIMRRYMGKCLYERTIYEDSNLDGKEEAYRDALRKACGFSYPEAYYLYDIEPSFAALWAVRGWLLGAALRRQLHRQYADEWFREADALQALQEFWGQSPYHTVEALMAQVGAAPPNIDPVVTDLLSDL